MSSEGSGEVLLLKRLAYFLVFLSSSGRAPTVDRVYNKEDIKIDWGGG
jgi:hypothetical protein